MPQTNKPTSSTVAKAVPMTQRYAQLQAWLQETQNQSYSLTLLAGDASFRCYYRLVNDKGSFIVMDAPPDKESCDAYVRVATLFAKAQVLVPHIYQQDLKQGFLLLSDLGDKLLLDVLNPTNVDVLYRSAFEALLKIQEIHLAPEIRLPIYGKQLLLNEMQLFNDWYLAKYKKRVITPAIAHELNRLFMLLVDNAKKQPQVCVHRDFHSRNLMFCEKGELGVLDFQDAVCGAITYDLVSLLRDCYLAWPQEKIEMWIFEYYSLSKERNRLAGVSYEEFVKWFDWMGLQRHLKCLGIFVRLSMRDQKSNYLNDIPRVLAYSRQICQKYSELTPLLEFLGS